MFDQYRYTAAIQHAWTVNFISSYNSSDIYIYIYICIHTYNIYIYISFFTSISRESSELRTAPLRLDAACMMATAECPRHLSAPLLLPEASQHVAHAYVWSSPGDNIKFPLFCPSFRVSFPVIRPWMACIACTTGFGFLKGWTSGTLSPHPRLLDSPTTWQFKKAGTMSSSSKDERSCDCCFRWPAKTHVWF